MQIRPLLGLAQGDLKSYYVILFKKVFLSFSLFCQRSINTKRVSLKMAKNGINKIGRFFNILTNADAMDDSILSWKRIFELSTSIPGNGSATMTILLQFSSEKKMLIKLPIYLFTHPVT